MKSCNVHFDHGMETLTLGCNGMAISLHMMTSLNPIALDSHDEAILAW